MCEEGCEPVSASKRAQFQVYTHSTEDKLPTVVGVHGSCRGCNMLKIKFEKKFRATIFFTSLESIGVRPPLDGTMSQ